MKYRIKKQLVLLLSAVILLLSLASTGYAESSFMEEYAPVFEKLGLIENSQNYINNPAESVTVGQAAKAVCGFFGFFPSNDAEALEICETMGIFENSVDATDNIKRNDAAEIFARALCQEILFEDYKDVLNKKISEYKNSILKGVKTSGEILNRESFVKMLDNTAMLGIAEAEAFSGSTVKIKISDTYTLLYKYRRIYTVEDVVTANDITTLVSPVGLSENHVKIGEKVYYDTTNRVRDEIGGKIFCYVQESSGSEGDILAYRTGKQKILYIDGNDIIDAASYSVSYKKNGKTVKENFSRYIDVIYNGKMIDALSSEVLNAKEGSLKFIDNNNDGTYDVAVVEKYVDYIIDGIDFEKGLVYGKNNALPLNISEKDNTVTFILTNTQITAEEFEKIIEIGDVLSVATSSFTDKNAKTTVKIGFDKIVGTINGYSDDEKKLTINSKEYQLSDSFANSTEFKKFSIGDSVKAYLNGFGRICYFENEAISENEEYGYLMMIAPKKGLKSAAQMKIFNQKGEIVVFDCEEKVKHNGDRKDTDELINDITADEFKQQLVIYKTNSSGKITSVETAAVGKDDNLFSLDIVMNNPRYYGDRNYMFASLNIDNTFKRDYSYDVSVHGVEYSLGYNAKILYIFKRDTQGMVEEKGLRWIESSALTDKEIYSKISMYDIDEAGAAAVSVLENSTDVLTDFSHLKNCFFTVVSKVSYSTDEETGEDYIKVDAWRQGVQQTYKIKDEVKITTSTDGVNDIENTYEIDECTAFLKKGDIIEVVLNEDEITAFRRIFTFDERKTGDGGAKTLYASDGKGEIVIKKNNTYEPTGMDTLAIFGTVAAKDSAQGVLVNTKTSDGTELFRVRQIVERSTSIYIIDCDEKYAVTKGSFKDIIAGKDAGSSIVMHSRGTKIEDVIIIKGLN